MESSEAYRQSSLACLLAFFFLAETPQGLPKAARKQNPGSAPSQLKEGDRRETLLLNPEYLDPEYMNPNHMNILKKKKKK